MVKIQMKVNVKNERESKAENLLINQQKNFFY